MKVRDYLSVPYILLAEPIEVSEGEWTRKLSYPELGDFSAQGQDVEQVLLDLERQRFAEIMRRLRAGDLPPVPRAPLQTSDPAWFAAFLGVSDLIAGQLDKTPAELTTA